MVGTVGLEPTRLAAHDPKSCLSANSSTSPCLECGEIIKHREEGVNKRGMVLTFYIYGIWYNPALCRVLLIPILWENYVLSS